MRRKGYDHNGMMAVENDITRTLIGACAVAALLIWLTVADQCAQEPAHAMARCHDGGLCMSDLAYAPGERPAVSIARLEVRR